MKVSVDRDQCISCALCWSSAPELFSEEASDGKCSVLAALRTGGDLSKGEAPEAFAPLAHEAADNCPVSIIHVE